MASYVPCKKNDSNGFITYVNLISQANPLEFQTNPTLAAGDVKIAIDDNAPANLGTLPVVDADFTKRVKVTLSQAETNGDNLTIIFSDASGAEWCDLGINIQTSGQTLDEIDTVADAVKAKTDNLPSTIKKNTAFDDFPFMMYLSDSGLPATDKTITAERLIDDGDFAACANSATEKSAGLYTIDLSASDLNGNAITFKFSATGCKTTTFTIFTKS